ncbi:hypothetical protein B0H19DRAFT_1081663 [Mycena capillaripes]|nr:hypothetical protein B0H19DRAFT_1081663 [Mycena capillaripes]
MAVVDTNRRLVRLTKTITMVLVVRLAVPPPPETLQPPSNSRREATSTPPTHDVLNRIRELEKIPASITSLQATVDSFDHSHKVVLSRAGANSGDAPLAPSAAEAAVLGTAVAAEDARLRAIVEDNDHDVEDLANHHPGIVMPIAFALPTSPAASVLPSRGQPAAAPATTAPPPPLFSFLPHALAGGSPRVRVDPVCEVIFGPMDWEGNWDRTLHNLIMSVSSHNTMRTTQFTSRRGSDDTTAILVFDADNVAS